MATTKLTKHPISTELAEWMLTISQEKLNDIELQEKYPFIVDYYQNDLPLKAFSDHTGYLAIFCDKCKKPSFAINTISAYNGAYNICVSCAKDYSICKKCNTYILTTDMGNPSHIHIGLDKIGDIHPEVTVEPYNADIMQFGIAYYLKTPKEQLIWKHQKEAHVSILTKPHSEGWFRYFGIELEVEKVAGAPPDMLERTKSCLGSYAMIKHDGSLSDHGANGFEIVTVPATLNFHKSGIWNNFFNNLGVFFQEKPLTTGLHIHVGIATLGEIVTGKMLIFINSIKNREFIESIAARELGVVSPNGKVYASVAENWQLSDVMKLRQHLTNCPWNPKSRNANLQYAINDKTGEIKHDPYGNKIIGSIKPRSITVRPTCKCPRVYNTHHYHSFNMMTKRPTVEFRIFRGVVDQRFLYSALEFCDALADFCSITSPAKLFYKDFLNWLCRHNDSGHTKLYPNLSRNLINKGWIDPQKSALKSGVKTATLLS